VVAALLIGAAAVTAAVDIISVQVGRGALIWDNAYFASQLRQTTWSDAAIVGIAAAAVVIGLVLLIGAVTAGRPTLVALVSDVPGEAVGTSRRSLNRALRRAALDVDGVDSAEVKLRRRAARVTVSSPFRDLGDLGQQVQSAVAGRLGQVDPVRTITVATRVRHRPSA
jgi:hypothetical protein